MNINHKVTTLAVSYLMYHLYYKSLAENFKDAQKDIQVHSSPI